MKLLKIKSNLGVDFEQHSTGKAKKYWCLEYIKIKIPLQLKALWKNAMMMQGLEQHFHQI